MRYLFLLLVLVRCLPGVEPLLYGHAHNDYKHERPLFEALENGFVSVEADVHVINERLYVSHDAPEDLSTTPTLEALYLDPLAAHIRKNNNKVYSGYEDFFYLMIDFKTPSEATYPVLRKALSNYADILSVVTDSGEQHNKPVKVFISGDRPIRQLLADSTHYAGLDGRPEDLGKGIPQSLMPVISQHYSNYLTWTGEGSPDPKEVGKLRQLIDAAHREDKKVRLWASPDVPPVWAFLISVGVDFINTDKLPELRAFYREDKARTNLPRRQ